MEYRLLEGSGLKIPALSFGTATFGVTDGLLRTWGSADVAEATRMIGICLDAGVNMIDCADVYSEGNAEEILGQAIAGRRDEIILSTKGSSRLGSGQNDIGSSRFHLIRACEASLRRLGTDHIDLYYLHSYDNFTPIEETLRALEDLVRSGKVLSVGCSNFSGWHLMKSIAAAERYGLPKFAAHQVSYSLLTREYEWELMPLAQDQKVSGVVWSPLSGGKLGGRVRRGEALPEGTRVAMGRSGLGSQTQAERLYDIVDALEKISNEIGKTVSQVALNWVLQRPTVSSVVFGARNEEQLRENLGAAGWSLSAEQIAALDTASNVPPIYPYSHQRTANRERVPGPNLTL